MGISITQAPDIECPSCRHRHYRDDYFELKLGTEIECPACGKTLEMVDEEAIRYWHWQEKR